MKKSFKLTLGIFIVLVLMLTCAFPALAYSYSDCPHYDSNYLGNGEYYCDDCGSYYYASYSSSSSYSDDDYSSSSSYSDDYIFEEVIPIVLGFIVLTLLAPWIILGIIILGIVIPTIIGIISNIILAIVLFIIGAIIFLLTPIIILAGAPLIFVSLV